MGPGVSSDSLYLLSCQVPNRIILEYKNTHIICQCTGFIASKVVMVIQVQGRSNLKRFKKKGAKYEYFHACVSQTC
jgi:hypothetical protein